MAGDKVYYTGTSETFQSGNRLEHGQQGEVMGPTTSERQKGKGVAVLFPGNKGPVNISSVRRRRHQAPPPSLRVALAALCLPSRRIMVFCGTRAHR